MISFHDWIGLIWFSSLSCIFSLYGAVYIYYFCYILCFTF